MEPGATAMTAAEGLQFPSNIAALRGTAWHNITDRATLSSETLLQLRRAQSTGLPASAI